MSTKCKDCNGLGRECMAGCSAHPDNWYDCKACKGTGLAPSIDEDKVRTDFEAMAAIVYPGAFSAGRNEIHGTYINSNLEKRWKGWKACEEFRAGITPTQQRGN